MLVVDLRSSLAYFMEGTPHIPRIICTYKLGVESLLYMYIHTCKFADGRGVVENVTTLQLETSGVQLYSQTTLPIIEPT